MDFLIGYEQSFSDKAVIWSPQKIDNPHIMAIGSSGSGKSYFARRLIQYLQAVGLNVIIFDLHGDMEIEGEHMIEFTLRNSPNGIQLFEFSKDERNGGVLVHTEFLVELIKKNFIPNMGALQESVLTKFLLDVYRSVGIFEEDSSTWDLELPTMEDMKNLYDKLIAILSYGAYPKFQDIFKQMSILCQQNAENSTHLGASYWASEKDTKKLESLINAFNEKFNRYNDYLYSANNIDEFGFDIPNVDVEAYLNRQSSTSLQGLAPYFEQILRASLFSNRVPRIQRGAVTTYSTFAVESFLLLQEGMYLFAFLNIGLNTFGTILFCAIGYTFAKYFFYLKPITLYLFVLKFHLNIYTKGLNYVKTSISNRG